MAGVQTVAVSAGDAGQRLDRWFRKHYPGVTHGRLQKLLRTGQVRVDGKRAAASLRLEAGQQVRVPPLSDAAAAPEAPRPKVAPADAAALKDSVLYRDDDILAIAKPPGLAVQGGSGVSRHVDGMLDALRFGSDERPRLVHRLDKDTSGVLLLARHGAAARWLTAAFRHRDTEKVYWALVAGVPKPPEGRIDAPLAKAASSRPGGREAVAVDPGGKNAVTLYRTVESAGRRAAWLELRPETGRTHQLRVHCVALGTPIIGDGKYGGRDAFVPNLPKRMHLHARTIRLRRPDGRMLFVTAPLSPAMAESWRFFGFSESDALASDSA